MEILAVSAAFAVLLVIFAILSRKNGWDKKRLILVCAFIITIYLGWLAKQFFEPALTSAPVPFFKLLSLSEYGYLSVLNDLVRYAVPFLPAGILLMFAFPVAGVGASALCGLLASLVMWLPGIIMGRPFVADEHVLAALGMATGTSFVVLFAKLFENKTWFDKTGLVAPTKVRLRVSLGVCIAVYFGVALVMIADYGSAYGELQLFESDTPLPADMTVACSLDTDIKEATIYSPDTENVLQKAGELANKFGITQNDFTLVDGDYSIASGTGVMLTVAPDGSWTYTFSQLLMGEVPDVELAEDTARDFFKQYDVLTLGELNEAVEKTNEQYIGEYDPESGYSQEMYEALLQEAKRPIGVDLYFNTRVDGHSIIGSNEVLVCVRADDVIIKVKKNDPELMPMGKQPVVSPQSAWEQLVSEGGAYSLFEPISKATLNSFDLVYMLESAKGNYLPAWRFKLTGIRENGSSIDFEAYVPALKG